MEIGDHYFEIWCLDYIFEGEKEELMKMLKELKKKGYGEMIKCYEIEWKDKNESKYRKF